MNVKIETEEDFYNVIDELFFYRQAHTLQDVYNNLEKLRIRTHLTIDHRFRELEDMRDFLYFHKRHGILMLQTRPLQTAALTPFKQV